MQRLHDPVKLTGNAASRQALYRTPVKAPLGGQGPWSLLAPAHWQEANVVHRKSQDWQERLFISFGHIRVGKLVFSAHCNRRFAATFATITLSFNVCPVPYIHHRASTRLQDQLAPNTIYD